MEGPARHVPDDEERHQGDRLGHDAGIWIDHRRAVIVRVTAEGCTTEAVESEVDDVIGHLAVPERLLIFALARRRVSSSGIFAVPRCMRDAWSRSRRPTDGRISRLRPG